jgi:hypothetical protein
MLLLLLLLTTTYLLRWLLLPLSSIPSYIVQRGDDPP